MRLTRPSLRSVGSRFSFANVTSGLCLAILVTSGTANAAVHGLVRSADILDGTVRSIDLRDGAVKSVDVADGSLVAADFAEGELPAGAQGERGPAGEAGPSARRVSQALLVQLEPTARPDGTASTGAHHPEWEWRTRAADGRDGDFYLNTTSYSLYGPKTAGFWPQGFSLKGADGSDGKNGVDGSAGAPGINGVDGLDGEDGTDGIDGNTLLSGFGTPSAQGRAGDFYLDRSTYELYGPRSANGWGAGVSLRPEGQDLFGVDDTPAVAGRSGEECTIGAVSLVAGRVASGVPADGRLLAVSQNVPLFSLLGTDFGGNGSSNFALPDLRRAAPKGLTYVICDEGLYPLGTDLPAVLSEGGPVRARPRCVHGRVVSG